MNVSGAARVETEYTVSNDAVSEICKAMGFNPNTVTKLIFVFDADTSKYRLKVTTIEPVKLAPLPDLSSQIKAIEDDNA
jgi:hypothetical protein